MCVRGDFGIEELSSDRPQAKQATGIESRLSGFVLKSSFGLVFHRECWLLLSVPPPVLPSMATMLSETYFTTELAGAVVAAPAVVPSAKNEETQRTLCWIYGTSTGKQKYGNYSVHVRPLGREKSMKIRRTMKRENPSVN